MNLGAATMVTVVAKLKEIGKQIIGNGDFPPPPARTHEQESARMKTDDTGGGDAQGHVRVLTFYDDDPDAQHSFAIGTEQNITTITEAFREYNMTFFWAIPGSGISGGKPMGVWVRGKHGGLNATWRQFMSRALDKVVPLIKSGAVIGVYLGDEVVCSGVSADDVTQVAEYTRSRIGPTALIYLNECGGGNSWTGPGSIGKQVPAAIDIISIDTYDLHNGTHEVIKARTFYESTVFPRLRPHQSAFVVPGLVGSSVGHAKPGADEDRQNLVKLNGYYEWAKADKRVTGLHPWHWWTRNKKHDPRPGPGPYYWGAEDFKLTRARLVEIGQEMRQMDQMDSFCRGTPCWGGAPS